MLLQAVACSRSVVVITADLTSRAERGVSKRLDDHSETPDQAANARLRRKAR